MNFIYRINKNVSQRLNSIAKSTNIDIEQRDYSTDIHFGQFEEEKVIH